MDQLTIDFAETIHKMYFNTTSIILFILMLLPTIFVLCIIVLCVNLLVFNKKKDEESMAVKTGWSA